MKEQIKVMISETEVDNRISEMAAAIDKAYAGKTVHLIGILKGSVFFMCELAKKITVPVTMDFMSVSSYGDDTKSSGIVKLNKDLDESIEGKVTITMENGDVIKAELYPDIAPNTVNNFISLVKKGFYNGLNFHRIINGFMIQGGCPEGTGMGGPNYSIKGEFSQNGFKNDLKHTEGVLSMARSMRPDSAGSQFFIMHKAAPHLDGAYAAFGKVIEGMDVVNKIATTRTTYGDRPVKEQKMASVTVDTFGIDYPEPEKA